MAGHPLDEAATPYIDRTLVHLEREFVPPVLRAFIDAVVEWAPRELGRAVPDACRDAWTEDAPAKPRRRSRARR